MTNSRFKRCPFCGSLPDHFGYTHEWVVLCECAAKPRVDEKTEEAALKAWNDRYSERESSEVVSVEKIARMGINVSWEELPEDVRKQKLAYARDVIAAAGFIPVMPISLDKCVASYQASPHSASGNYSMRGCVIAVLEAAGVKYE